MKELLTDTKAKKGKKNGSTRFSSWRYFSYYSHIGHMVYPTNYDNLEDRKMYKRVIMESKNE